MCVMKTIKSPLPAAGCNRRGAESRNPSTFNANCTAWQRWAAKKVSVKRLTARQRRVVRLMASWPGCTPERAFRALGARA